MRPPLCTQCVLLPQRRAPHFFLRAIDAGAAEDARWVFRCELCLAEWSLEATGDGEAWILRGATRARRAGS
jgi:hypothetical protein